jgi:hypothetical protein
MEIATLIIAATIRGATVNTTSDYGVINTVQVIGLRGMSAWPLPVRWAEAELRDAIGRKA